MLLNSLVAVSVGELVWVVHLFSPVVVSNMNCSSPKLVMDSADGGLSSVALVDGEAGEDWEVGVGGFVW